MDSMRVLLLCGGQSDEHEVSLLSAKGVLASLRQLPVAAALRVLTRDGRLLGAADSECAVQAGRVAPAAAEAAAPLGALSDALAQTDVVFPLLHGPYGEDGTLQGLLRLHNVAFVGSGVLGSALCMDKPMSKQVLHACGVPQVDYALVTRGQWQSDAAAALARARAVGPVTFVKPANLGSSVGIHKAKSEPTLVAAIEDALRFDRRVIVERAVGPIRECEVAVLGNDVPRVSVVGEITYTAEFYDYETKYTEGRSRMVVPAVLPADAASEMQRLARQAFVALDCAGLARVDFFYLPETRQILLNEINTMPGFTPFSMYPRLWAETGLAYPDLLMALFAAAQARQQGRA